MGIGQFLSSETSLPKVARPQRPNCLHSPYLCI